MKFIYQFGAAAVLLLACSSECAKAANCSPYTYNLQNGTTADANQVMNNFNNILGCGNSNLLGRTNNLSDVQSTSTSRTNLGLGASAVENLGNNIADDGSGNLLSKSSLQASVFTSSSTFTIPVGTTTATVYKISIIGGGGGGGGASGGASNTTAGGGASGAYCVGWFSGFAVGQVVTVTVGTGGAGGIISGGGTGTAGLGSNIAYNSANIITALASAGGAGVTSGATAAGGNPGTCVIQTSTSGLTLQASQTVQGQPGGNAIGAYFSGSGGTTLWGTGGSALLQLGSAHTGGAAATNGGGGGSGAVGTSGTGAVGGAGAAGQAVIEWVQ